uniref:Mitochondrial import inner membrane translocase subunit Tim10 B n=1 Tax=Electrophorus electricus TaxID=8005 RepID=A0A4W4FL62_ELEEL
MDTDGQLRNLRDFLLVYNRMTEICFQRCTSNFNYRSLTMDEERCVDSCAGKLIRSNHRLMGTYVKLMPGIVKRRMEEMESKAAETAEAAAPVQPLAGTLATSEGPSAITTESPPVMSSSAAPAAPSAGSPVGLASVAAQASSAAAAQDAAISFILLLNVNKAPVQTECVHTPVEIPTVAPSTQGYTNVTLPLLKWT